MTAKKRRQEESAIPPTNQDRALEKARRAAADGEARYRVYWLSLDPRDRERLPPPGA